jgi:Protein of unknown function (DUF4038)/Putative collagen-binding domain of a collagenase
MAVSLMPLACDTGRSEAAAPTFVQLATAVPQSPQSAVSARYSGAQTAGNTNIVAVGWNNATSNITSLTDSRGNVYALAAPVTRGSGLSQAIYYAKNIVASPANGNTVRVVFNTSTAYVDLRVTEYAGLDKVNPFDKTASATGTDGSPTTAAVQTTSSSELVFGAGMTTGMFSSASRGFITRVITSPDADIVFDKSVASTGSYNVSARAHGSWVLQMATFRSAAASAEADIPAPPATTSPSTTTSTSSSTTSTTTTSPTTTSPTTTSPTTTSPTTTSSTTTTSTTTTTTQPPAPPATGSVFPLSVSSNHRYVVDRTGTPFPIMGRTAWFITALTSADYRTFIDDTVAKGYNSIEFHVINHDGRGKNPPFNGNGALPFLKNLNGGTYTGILADQGGYNSGLAPDFTTPNPVFWSYVDGLLDYAQSKNMAVFMFPAYVGAGGGTSQGWMTEMTANGQAKMQTYGTFIADRYKNRGNIVWMMGGDYGHFNSSQLAAETGLLNGLKSVSGQSTFISAEWDSAVNATDQPDLGSQMTLNGVYDWGGNIFDQARDGYGHSPTTPAFLLEEPYDEEGPDGNGVNRNATQPTRRFQWWGWLGSIGGYISGNGYVWTFQSGWQNHLNTTTAQDMARLNAFMQSYKWYDLVPSGQGGMKNLVTAGGGSGGGSNATAVSASATPDGTLLIAYVPPAHTGSVTIDMTALSGSVTARWFDPTRGTYTAISGSPFANTGTRAFTTPGNNGAGQADWVLVLTRQ